MSHSERTYQAERVGKRKFSVISIIHAFQCCDDQCPSLQCANSKAMLMQLEAHVHRGCPKKGRVDARTYREASARPLICKACFLWTNLRAQYAAFYKHENREGALTKSMLKHMLECKTGNCKKCWLMHLHYPRKSSRSAKSNAIAEVPVKDANMICCEDCVICCENVLEKHSTWTCGTCSKVIRHSLRPRVIGSI
eukprot:5375912-Pleurochrysis_carterae.AAC.1